MPTYQFCCTTCGTEREVFARVSDKEASTPVCCGQKSETILQPTYGYVQSECHYQCPVTRQGVSSWKQRKEIFAKYNLCDGSDFNPAQEIARQKKIRDDNAKLAAQMPHFGEHPAL